MKIRILSRCGVGVLAIVSAFLMIANAQAAIYGSDGQLDLYQLSDSRVAKLADSVAIVLPFWSVRAGNDSSTEQISVEPLASARNVCSSERFAQQPSVRGCTAVLIDSDKVLTAGHCMRGSIYCMGTAFVFGYSYRNQSVDPSLVSSSDVYSCQKIIDQTMGDHGLDFAIVQLGRRVEGHAPVEVESTDDLAVGTGVFMIGHALGLPTKIDEGKKVRSIQDTRFLANLDSFDGSSGSPVFNAQTLRIEGILTNGDADFTETQSGCNVAKQCPNDGCRGETVIRAPAILRYLSSSNGSSAQ